MKFPKLQEIASSRQLVDVFGGYNHNLRIGDGEFYEMQNMTSDHYPLLSPRGPRGVWLEGGSLNGIVTNNGLCYIDGNQFVLPSGTKVELGLTDGIKTLVSMGAYVIILPDKKWINVVQCLDAVVKGEDISEDMYGDIDLTWILETTAGQPGRAYVCFKDGKKIDEYSFEKPSNPSDGAIWADYTENEMVYKKWYVEEGMWLPIKTYIRIEAFNGICPFEAGSDVVITRVGPGDYMGYDLPIFNRIYVNHTEGYQNEDCYIVIDGTITAKEAMNGEFVKAELGRTMPDMDFVVESGNRLWGCKYGNTENGFINEIYASKLGDFKNWHSFQGISTDSYVASIGADGPFTGAICYQGRPVFFKENCMIEVYGSYPAAYQVQTTPCVGVQSGCERSLAVVNNVLYYKSRAGVCAFDGSLPVQMGQALGPVMYESAVAGGCGNKYYISMHRVGGNDADWHLFVYDTAKGLWHREDDLQAVTFCGYQNELYGISEDRATVFTMLGSGVQDDRPVQWMVQSGEIGLSLPDMKYISRLTVRLSLEEGSEVSFYVQYDFEEEWEHICTIPGTSLRSFSIPIRPKRCDHMKLRIEGIGGAKLYSITKTIEQGSDVS